MRARQGQERLCAVSVDLDGLDCYYRIHGLGRPTVSGDPVALEAPPRFADLFGARRIPATFFVVGEYAASASGRDALPRLRAAGHELGNHSHGHRYDLFRLGPAAMRDEVRRAHEAIPAAAGAPPRGFRAPGYGISAGLLEEIAAAGYAYDSSILPSPPYYAAKAAVMGALWLVRRPSGSALADPRLAAAPSVPYRPDPAAPWRRGQAAVVELPVTVMRGLRVPLIGTVLTTAPGPLRRILVGALVRARFINLELHGVDLVDAAADGVPEELARRQPELRVPLGYKRAALARTLDAIAAAGFRFVRLLDAANAVQRGEL